MKINVTAPLRVDLGGGKTDVPQFGRCVGTSITNIALDLYDDAAHKIPRSVHVEVSDSSDAANNMYINNEICDVGVRNVNNLFYEAIFSSFLARNDTYRKYGITLKIFNTLPVGTGLGGSAMLSLCISAGLNRFIGNSISRDSLLRQAHYFETVELGILGGIQDYIAACFGGCNYINFTSLGGGDLAARPGIGQRLARPTEDFLNENMILIMLRNENTNSAMILKDELKNLRSDQNRIVESLHELKRHNTKIYELLQQDPMDSKQWTGLGEEINASWAAQKRLSRLVGGGRLGMIENLIRPYTYGVRGPGSGNNSLFLLAKPNQKNKLIAKLNSLREEIEIFHGRINYGGLQVTIVEN